MAFRSDLIELFCKLLDDQVRREAADALVDEKRRKADAKRRKAEKKRRKAAESLTDEEREAAELRADDRRRKADEKRASPPKKLTPWEYAVRWMHSTYGLKWLDDRSEYVDPEPAHGSNLREFLAICRLQDAGVHDIPDTEIASDLQRLNREGVTAELKKDLRDRFGESLEIAKADNASPRDDDAPEPPTATHTEAATTESEDGTSATVDLRDYVSATEIRTKHTPEGIVLDQRRLVKFLNFHQSIRTERPRGKDGKPRKNRLLVHLADWVKHLDALKEWDAPDNDSIDAVPVSEIAKRAAAIRRKKQRGK